MNAGTAYTVAAIGTTASGFSLTAFVDTNSIQGVFTVRNHKDLIVYAVGSPANGTLGVLEETLSAR